MTIEKIPEVTLPPLFSQAEKPALVDIILLLSGSCTVNHPTGLAVQVSSAAIPLNEDSITKSDWISLQIYDERSRDFESDLSAIRYHNVGFWNRIRDEISSYWVERARGNDLGAFVYLYRWLESMSYAYPMIYVSRSTDFLGSFQTLKGLFSGQDGGELNFFGKFIQQIFQDPSYIDATIGIDIKDIDLEDEKRKIFNVLRRVRKEAKAGDEANDVEFDSISIGWLQFGTFCVQLRNRFFHARAGETTNIKISEVNDPNLLFRQVNDQFYYWNSVQTLEIVKTIMASRI